MRRSGGSTLSGWPDRDWILFIYKAITGILPLYMTSMVSLNVGSYQTPSSNWIMLQVVTRLENPVFLNFAPANWNNMENERLPHFYPWSNFNL